MNQCGILGRSGGGGSLACPWFPLCFCRCCLSLWLEEHHSKAEAVGLLSSFGFPIGGERYPSSGWIGYFLGLNPDITGTPELPIQGRAKPPNEGV